ncbi:MAG TPA: CU044_2847 family protein [Thermoanaerobaculia bacterium]
MLPHGTSVAIATIKSQEIAIEITPNVDLLTPGSSDVEMVGARRSLPDRMRDLTDLIHNTATGLVDSIGALPAAARPQAIDAEFSIAFSAEAGFWYIAKGSATGAIKVTLKWEL